MEKEIRIVGEMEVVRLGRGSQGRVKGAVVALPPAETPISSLREIDHQFDHSA